MSLVGALLFGQSGGPSSVINASACGVFETASNIECITAVYGASHGIKGILNEQLYDISKEDSQEIALLRNTPSSALGSVRYKLKNYQQDSTDYEKILQVFTKYNIRYFLYNGGNDSMDTCNKISKFLAERNYACQIIGVPKTIDNDLFGTDHCPGYGSAAKYIATTCMEIALDAKVYGSGTATVIEIMGRNAGWLTAASYVASSVGLGPDLIYLPERAFDVEKFLIDCEKVYAQKGNVIVAISEGIKDKDGVYITEYATKNASKDSFNHVQLGGVGNYLGALLKVRLNAKTRPIEFSLMQRCAAHIASKTDVDEAYGAGKEAVISAIEGKTDIMIGIKRLNKEGYSTKFIDIPLVDVANYEKKMPDAYICGDNYVSPAFLDYVLPLIEGQNPVLYINGVPRFANLKKILVKK